VKVEVLDKPTQKARAKFGGELGIGRFLSSLPLYRSLDGEELLHIFDTGEIKGGDYSVGAERAYGSQWGASLEKVARWGEGQRGHRLGHELFVAEIQGKGRVFAHLSAADAQMQPGAGVISIDPAFCFTGLGCSVKANLSGVVQWYIVEDGVPRKITHEAIKRLLPQLGLKKRKVDLWLGMHPLAKELPVKVASALRYEIIEENIRDRRLWGWDADEVRREAIKDLKRQGYAAAPMDKAKLGRLLFRAASTLPYMHTQWESLSSEADEWAGPFDSDGVRSFAITLGVTADVAIPYYGADLTGQQAKVKMARLDVPPTGEKPGHWAQVWAPWSDPPTLTIAKDEIRL
jgi:hypothetical protein